MVNEKKEMILAYCGVKLNPKSIKTLRELEQTVGRRIPRIEQFKWKSLGYKVMKGKITDKSEF
jgi:hypothetical protein